jgi:hypothetical protein
MAFEQSVLKSAGLMFVSAEGELFNHCDTDGPMWTGRDDREFRFPVTFDAEFAAAPLVTLGLSGIDIAHEQNARLVLQASEVGPKGFTILLRTWSDTRIGRASVNWMAVGPLPEVKVEEPLPIVPPRNRQRGGPGLEALIERERRLSSERKPG